MYDGSQYIDNDINEDCIFEYRWFDNYFTDNDRNAYFIKSGNAYAGMVMVNENLKFNKDGKCIAEFLIMPRFRKNHIGKKVAYEIFEKFKNHSYIRRQSWSPDVFIQYRLTAPLIRMVMFAIADTPKMKAINTLDNDIRISAEDLLADDWEDIDNC